MPRSLESVLRELVQCLEQEMEDLKSDLLNFQDMLEDEIDKKRQATKSR